MREIEGLTPEELAHLLGGSGRARAVWRDIADGGVPSLPDSVTSVQMTPVARAVARCGTTKLRLRLADGKDVEAVVIPSKRRTTVCVSTQVGCARKCIFCVTATMGLERGLTTAEIVGQVTSAIREAGRSGLSPVRNIVYMGMGEPLDNLEAVTKSLDILCAPLALGLGPAHVTVSTVGTTPDAIAATRNWPARLAWSLHAVDDDLRRKLVPTARASTDELRSAFIERGGTLFVEVTLIERLNDGPDHAEAMADFLEPFEAPVRVNLLPMNVGREGLEPSSRARAVAFRQHLRDRGYFCAIREPRGADASAACGQLALR